MIQTAYNVGSGGLAPSVNRIGRAVAPLAAANIIAPFSPGAGVWAIRASGVIGGAAILGADIGNMELQVDGISQAIIPVPSDRAVVDIALLSAVSTVSVRVVGNATAAMVYVANLALVRVSG